MTQHTSPFRDPSRQAPRRGLGWLLVGGALLLASISIHGQLARQGSSAAASGAPSPGPIVAITATQLSLGSSRLFAMDQDKRLWSCQVNASLICHWIPVLQPRVK